MLGTGRHRMRGGAAVELLLSVPFLFLFAVAMFDFAKAYSVRTHSEQAARHLAWSGARNADYGSPAIPTSAALRQTHARPYVEALAADLAPAPVEEAPPGILGAIASAVTTIVDALETALSALPGVGHVDLLSGMPRFLTATVEMRDAKVSMKITPRVGIGGLRLGPQNVTARHYVSLKSYRDRAHPDDPEGWFDPIARLFHQIESWFS